MYIIYWLINESKTKTYISFTKNLKKRIEKHKNKGVKFTKKFGNFKCYILEKVGFLDKAIKKERYWKSGAGRRRLKRLFIKLK